MKIIVEINNSTRGSVDNGFVRKIAAEVIKKEAGNGPDGPDEREVEVSIAFISPARIRQINRKYRKIDRVTDVLSFEEKDQFDARRRILGELAICPKQVEEDAKRSQTSVKKETAWVIVHGMLHLFGYDHEGSEADARSMREREARYLASTVRGF